MKVKEVKNATKRHTKEFKDSTIQLVLNGDKSATEVANNLGIQVKTLYSCIRKRKEINNIHYVSCSHKKPLQDNGIIQSMSRKGNCWDKTKLKAFFIL